MTASVTATSQHNLLHSRCMVLSSYISVYTASRKKQETLLRSITSQNIIRFSKFFHC